MFVNRGWFLTAISVTAAGMLAIAPAVHADDDHGSGRGGGDDKHAPPIVRVEDNNKNEVEHQNEAVERQNREAEEAAEKANEVAEEAAEKANEAAEEAAEKANEAAEKAAERANEAAEKAAERANEAAEEAAENAVAAPGLAVRAANLVAAFQAEPAQLAALAAMAAAPVDVDEDEDVDVEDNEAVEEARIVNLSTLTAGLTGADLTAVTNAANADAAGVANFFAAVSPAAMAIKAKLAARGINPASVLAILPRGDEHATIVLNA